MGGGFRATYPGSSGADRSQYIIGDDQQPYLYTPSGALVAVAELEDPNAAEHSNANMDAFTLGQPDAWGWFWGSLNGGSTAQETSDVLFSGSAAKILTAAGGGNYQVGETDVFPVKGGETVEFWLWGKQLVGIPKISLGILTARTGTPDFFGTGTEGVESPAVTMAGDYTRYRKAFAVPPGHTQARVFFRIVNTGGEATESLIDATGSRRAGVAVAAGAGYRGSAVVTQNIPHNTPTTIQLGGTVDFDNGGVSIASHIVTLTDGGTYRLNANVQYAPGAAGRRRASIETWTGADPGVGLATQVAYAESYADTTVNPAFSPSTSVTLPAGSNLRLVGFVTTTTTGAVSLGNVFGYPPQLIINREA